MALGMDSQAIHRVQNLHRWRFAERLCHQQGPAIAMIHERKTRLLHPTPAAQRPRHIVTDVAILV
eukprot:scaffold90725_cov33-Tisochrysis_lutea.AAC.2